MGNKLSYLYAGFGRLLDYFIVVQRCAQHIHDDSLGSIMEASG